MSLPTISQINKTIGSTWFDEDCVCSDLISISTRDHGDVGGECPGDKDIIEARRIIKILKEAYPNLYVTGDTCDEWVSVEIRSK
jgi:hypothetical protein